MNSFIASPEFDTQAEVELWTKRQKAAPAMYDLLKKIIKYCIDNNVQLLLESKDLLGIAKQLTEEIDSIETGGSDEQRIRLFLVTDSGGNQREGSSSSEECITAVRTDPGAGIGVGDGQGQS